MKCWRTFTVTAPDARIDGISIEPMVVNTKPDASWMVRGYQ